MSTLAKAIDDLCEAAGMKASEVMTIRYFKHRKAVEYVTRKGIKRFPLETEVKKPAKKAAAKKTAAKKS